ncbi:holin [Embleya sp. NPDC050154]|uniref:holin n=1 Tax=Embleya sp. NPDC050154 TaxID=3363988 RepID=UPI0037B9A862
MMTKAFWRAATERSGRTFAQALIAVFSIGTTGLMDADWAGGASVAGMAAVLSLLTSIATSGVGPEGPGLTEVATSTRRSLPPIG